MPKLTPDCLTVTGKTIYGNVKSARVYNSDIVRTLDHPVSKEPGIGVLYGNLAPEGAIVKIAAVPQQLMQFTGTARVFDSLDSALAALRGGEVQKGDALVLRYMGLKGRFGTTAFTFQEELKGNAELYHSCAVITDGRFSGGTSGLSVGYLSPEAALCGPLAAVRDGDKIEINIPERQISLCIPQEEIESRLKEVRWDFPKDLYPRYLNLFVKNVGSMAKGGIWEE